MNPNELINKAKEYREEFKSLRKQYKEKQLKLLETRKPELKNYNEEYIQEQIKREIGQLAEEQKKKARDFFEGTEIYLKSSIRKIEELRFPLSAGSSEDKVMLELIRQRAFNFLSQVTDFRKVENELKESSATDENYFSALLKVLDSRRKDYFEMKEDEREFYSKVDKIKQDFESSRGIRELEIAKETFAQLNKESRRYLNALNDGYVGYYTESEVRAMNQEEANQEYDIITASMQYWNK